MAFNNSYFRGSIDNKTILDYKNKLDYNIDNLEERKLRSSFHLKILTAWSLMVIDFGVTFGTWGFVKLD